MFLGGSKVSYFLLNFWILKKGYKVTSAALQLLPLGPFWQDTILCHDHSYSCVYTVSCVMGI